MTSSNTNTSPLDGGYHPAMLFSSQRFCRRLWLAVVPAMLLLTVAVAFALTGSNDDARHALRMLKGAASADHAWFVVPSDRDPDRWHLLHHAREMAGPYSSPQPISVLREPEAMAAFGNRVWLIYPPRMEDEQPGQRGQRGVYTVAVERDPALELYRPSPRDRLQLLEALPASGRVAGFTATDRGPIVLIVPDDEVKTPADAGESGEAPIDFADAVDRQPRLLQLRSKRWNEFELPAEANITRAARLAVKGRDRSQLVLLTVDPSAESRTVMYRQADDDDSADTPARWERSTLDFDLRQVLSMATTRGRLAAVVQDQPGEAARLQYLRPTRALELGELPEPRGRWTVLGLSDGLRMIEYSTRDGTAVRRIDPVTGNVSEAESMHVQPLPAGRMWYTSLLLLAAVVAVLLVLLVRPSRQEKVELPKGIGVMPPFPRFLALLMDLFPGGILSMLVLGASPIDVLRLPIFTDSLEVAAPFLLMMAVALVHMTLTELVKGTTLGKALMGARVISIDGDRPDAKQVLIRNAVKALILLVPVLAIFALLNPNLRGFNDLVARTVVVGDVEVDDEGGEKNTSSREEK